MSTLTIDRLAVEVEGDEKLSRGLSAIAQAIKDVRDGTLVCDCPECELRRITT